MSTKSSLDSNSLLYEQERSLDRTIFSDGMTCRRNFSSVLAQTKTVDNHRRSPIASAARPLRVGYLNVIRSVRLRVEAPFFKGSFVAFELC
jgi:hypothetical protein